MSIDAIYVIHHTHTDVGFTNDQPIFWEMQYRFIDEALRLIERYAGNPAESRFRWTVETTCGLEEWLKTASSRDIDRLIAADGAGLLEVMAMQTNNTPLLNTAQLIESLRPVERLRRDFGLDIRYAMNCDINGQNWPLGDVLLKAGIEGFSMAINHHFGGPPHPRPNVFLWEAPSGRVIPAHNGWQYSKACDFGLGNDSEESFLEWLPKIEAYLNEINYPLPFLMLQGYHPFGDNGSAWAAFAEFACRWNEAGHSPKVITATPRMFWERVKNHHADLKRIRGDWTDYWNFGCISSARETTIALTSRSRLYRSDALFAALKDLTPGASPAQEGEANFSRPAGESLGAGERWSQRSNHLYRDAAWRALNLYGEHTWGADTAANDPQLEDSLAMDNYKKNLAYTARSLSLLLERDALADLSRLIPRNDQTDLLLFNPLPWERTVSGAIPKNVLIPRGLNDDPTSSRHFLGRNQQPTDFWTGRSDSAFNGGMGWMLQPTTVPAFGYAVVGWEALTGMVEAEEGEDAVVENQRYRITFDTQKGGIRSLFDKQLNHEWVDPSAGYPLHGFVHEEVADHETPEPRKRLFEIDWAPTPETIRGWHSDWQASRTTPVKVLLHKTYRLAFGTVVEQILEHPQVGNISQRMFLPDQDDQIEFQSEWQMGTCIHPEATYLLFPFNIPNAQARFDIGGVPVRPHLDQLPGSCRDYFTVQGWVDFNDGERGMAIATPENPMVQLGDFHFAHNQQEVMPERAMLLGWVTNNYWETNFPGAQPGTVTARYAILPYAGGFDESRAHRFAAETEHSRPLVQHLGETPAQELLPATGTLLHLPELPIMILSLRATPAGGALLTLFNASDTTQTASISSGLLEIHSAERCDLFGSHLETLVVNHGTVEINIPQRQIFTLAIG
ncbi:MAG: glycoside hydrolase family 38 C-terminal domain-containing protein [Bacteroidota bacterium]